MKILFEDKYLIIVEKEPGVIVQDDKNSTLSLLSELEKIKNTNLFLFNRLDRPVGGIVLLGKNKKVSGPMQNLINTKSITKKYLAVVTGISKNSDQLEDSLLKNSRLNKSKVVNKNSKGSKIAKLSYKKLFELNYKDIPISLLEVTLETGRHHQIRVQLANQNLGLFGDNKYNNIKIHGPIGLWCYNTIFTHPITNEVLNIKSLPKDTIPFNLFDLGILQK